MKAFLRLSAFMALTFSRMIIFAASPISFEKVGHWAELDAGYLMGISVVENVGYVAAGPRMSIYDLSAIESPRKISSMWTTNFANDIAVKDGRAYVAVSYSGLQIIDVQDSANPRPLGHVKCSGEAWDVALSGGYAFLASTGYGLHVVDVSNPSQPIKVGGAATQGSAGGVRVEGNRAYLCEGRGGVAIFGIADPVHPKLLGRIQGVGWADDLVAKGNIVHVADSTSAPLFGAGVFTIDVTDPSNAVILGRSKIGSTYSLALSENALFATGRGHLTILDLEDPARPVIRGAWKSSLIHRDLDLAGDHAVLASVGEGLHVIDIKEPTAPVLAGTSAPSTEDARGISVRGGTGLVAGGSRGLILLDVANPTLIREQTRYVPGGLTDD